MRTRCCRWAAAIASGLLSLAGCSAPPRHLPASPFSVPLAAPVQNDPVTPQSDTRETPALETLDALRRLAASRNPGLRALFERWRAQAERAPQVRSLPEPRFTFTEYLRSVETRTGPQERSFALSQSFPWFGTLGLRGSVEEARAAAAWQRFLGAQLALDHAVRTTWADYFFLGRSISITRENLDLLARLEGVVREKFAAGADNHPDLIRLQVEIGRLEDRLSSLLDMKRPLQSRLNALVSRPTETEIAFPQGLVDDDPDPDSGTIARLLEGHNPELAALRHEVESAELGRRLARRESFPDFSVGVQTISTGSALAPNTRDSGEDPWLATFSIELPLWVSKYRAAEREAEARLHAARESRQDAEDRLAADVELALFESRDARRRIDLYAGTLIRKAEESLASTEASFQADSSTFLDLIDAERALLELRLTGERARADRLRARAKLDRLLGRFVIPGALTAR